MHKLSENVRRIVRETYPSTYGPIILSFSELHDVPGILEWRESASHLWNLIRVESGAALVSAVLISSADKEMLLTFDGNPLNGFTPVAHFLYWDLARAVAKRGKARQRAIDKAVDMAALALTDPDRLPKRRAERLEERMDREAEAMDRHTVSTAM